MKISKKNLNNECGAIIVLVSMISIVLIQFLAMGIDLARIYISQLERKSASEYAATVGLYEFVVQRDHHNKSFREATKLAFEKAEEALIFNKYIASENPYNLNPDTLTMSLGIINGANSYQIAKELDYNSINGIRVMASPSFSSEENDGTYTIVLKGFSTYFARIMGWDNIRLSATSVAKIDPLNVLNNKNPIKLIQ